MVEILSHLSSWNPVLAWLFCAKLCYFENTGEDGARGYQLHSWPLFPRKCFTGSSSHYSANCETWAVVVNDTNHGLMQLKLHNQPAVSTWPCRKVNDGGSLMFIVFGVAPPTPWTHFGIQKLWTAITEDGEVVQCLEHAVFGDAPCWWIPISRAPTSATMLKIPMALFHVLFLFQGAALGRLAHLRIGQIPDVSSLDGSFSQLVAHRLVHWTLARLVRWTWLMGCQDLEASGVIPNEDKQKKTDWNCQPMWP